MVIIQRVCPFRSDESLKEKAEIESLGSLVPGNLFSFFFSLVVLPFFFLAIVVARPKEETKRNEKQTNNPAR